MRRPGAIWRELVKNLRRKPATVLYPAERLEIPENFRGRPVFNPATCIGCMMCVRDCPAKAVKIEKVGEKKFSCTFYLDRCIYCGQCSDSCVKKSITMSHEFELACFDRSTLVDTKKEDAQAAK
ncbi:MAG: hypothetical protein A2219_01160 [Elusimicrobia bacterium RIFOXYA2_FULL_50_26]|nr:MAG: hypothetical protein A2219_01160 [Elusimicrobia bacterium RIFOXYA2_FULL_50_26]OGS23420.1 MAG: hypothetical protein A2314_00690 [Elusimicrobia bacterium RIFOXYB2_FULL_50_12]